MIFGADPVPEAPAKPFKFGQKTFLFVRIEEDDRMQVSSLPRLEDLSDTPCLSQSCEQVDLSSAFTRETHQGSLQPELWLIDE